MAFFNRQGLTQGGFSKSVGYTTPGGLWTKPVPSSPMGIAQWAARIGGTGNDEGNGVTTDSLGNIYVTGTYQSNPVTIYNSDGSTFGTLVNSSYGNGSIVKYNSSGTVQWATRIGGTGGSQADSALGIKSDSSGNIYVTGGYYTNPVTIYNSDGSTFGTLANSGIQDGYFVKYNASGTAQWATRIGGTARKTGTAITSDSSGNMYVIGTYESNPVTVYNSDGSTFGTLANSGLSDVFVVKYNSAGTTQWAARISGTGNDYSSRITSDSSGNIYVTGSYASNPVTVYNSDGSTFGTLVCSGSLDIFIVKYNSSGTAQWTARIGGSDYETSQSITSDSSGNIYVTGSYQSNPVTIYNSDGSTFGTLTNYGIFNIIIVKYNSSGTAQWATQIGGSTFEQAGQLTSDSFGNIYVTGNYQSNPVTVYNSDGSTFGTLTNYGYSNLCIVKYNSAGTAQWATQIGGSSYDFGISVTSDSPGNIYVAGSYQSNPVTVYNSDGSTFGTLVNSGVNDIFIVKYVSS